MIFKAFKDHCKWHWTCLHYVFGASNEKRLILACAATKLSCIPDEKICESRDLVRVRNTGH